MAPPAKKKEPRQNPREGEKQVTCGWQQGTWTEVKCGWQQVPRPTQNGWAMWTEAKCGTGAEAHCSDERTYHVNRAQDTNCSHDNPHRKRREIREKECGEGGEGRDTRREEDDMQPRETTTGEVQRERGETHGEKGTEGRQNFLSEN